MPNRRKLSRFIFASLIFLSACAPQVAPTSTPLVITVYASPATQPWLSEAYTCAGQLRLVLSNSNDPVNSEMVIQMGEPAKLETPAFQIGNDDLMVIAHRESLLQNMTIDQVRALFSDPGAAAQVWVFAPGEDIQQVFTREVMQNSGLTSQARLALSPQQMSDMLNKEKDLVGILPRRWKAGSVRELFTLKDAPILALTKSEPQGALKELLGCLQKGPAQ